MPALEALVHRFRDANTQPLGVSVDSVHSHANWAGSLGGISFPLLADFHPKGAVAAAYGAYLPDRGHTARATVIVDAAGVVRYASLSPPGGRDIAELRALCEGVSRAYSGALAAPIAPLGVGGATLFVKNNCAPSRSALLARTNLHLESSVSVKNVSEDPAALAELVALTAKEQAPALVLNGEVTLESPAIIARLVSSATSL